jgi:hypothetical protein
MSAEPLRERAPGKVNLSLFIGPTRASDGRHELVSVMQSVTLADDHTLEPAPDGAGADEVVCPGVDGDNLALDALRAFRAATGWDAPPQRLTIAKRVPVAAGMGGGSGDAAAALRLAARAPATTRCCTASPPAWARTSPPRCGPGACWPPAPASTSTRSHRRLRSGSSCCPATTRCPPPRCTPSSTAAASRAAPTTSPSAARRSSRRSPTATTCRSSCSSTTSSRWPARSTRASTPRSKRRARRARMSRWCRAAVPR